MSDPAKTPFGRGGRGAAILHQLALQKASVASRRPGDEQGASAPTTAAPSTSSEPKPPTLASATGLAPITSTAPSMGRCRMLAQMSDQLKQTPSAEAASASTPPRMPLPGGGRGLTLARSFANMSMASPPTRMSSPAPSVAPSQASMTSQQPQQLQLQTEYPASVGQRQEDAGDQSLRSSAFASPSGSVVVASEEPGVTRPFDKSRESAREPVFYRGNEGQGVSCSVNHIPIRLKEGMHVIEYAVMYAPQVDSKNFRHKLLNQHREALGPAKSFDGQKLYITKSFPDKETVFFSQHPVDGSAVSVTLRYITKRNLGECPHLFDSLFRRVMKELQLVPIGRKNFDPSGSVQIPKFGLEMWPGYITAIQNFEGGLMLLAETSSRVLRTGTILDQLYEFSSRGGNYRDAAERAIIGCVILTKYNNQTYRIDDIDWTKSPMSTFEGRNGVITFADYYLQHYNIRISDMSQPLLLHRAKNRLPGGGSGEPKTDLLYMVPELSYQTGLTDDMRSNFHLMKEIAATTRLAPKQRQFQLMKLVNAINSNPRAKEHLDAWGIEIRPQTIQVDGRVLVQEKIFFRDGKAVPAGDTASWQGQWGKNQVLNAVHFERWLVIFTDRDKERAQGFVEMARRVGPQLGIDIHYPRTVRLPDDRNETLMRSLREQVSRELQIVVIINPTSRDDRYSLIKKLCCGDENPVPSQVINGRTLSQPAKLRSVCQNIVLQMNAKLGGELWSLDIPIKQLMVCGIDVYHEAANKSKSVLSLVSSLNKPLTRWFCRSNLQSSGQEIGVGIEMLMIQTIRKYHQVNHALPEKIIIFRDGVGDGQMDYVIGTEIPQFHAAFKSFGPDYVPVLTYVVVQKRINTRIFLNRARGELDNPPPGAVLDHTVTKRHWEDFFLVSQHVRQGTVTPTHYVVLHNESKLTPDKIQRLTYKMTHLYYNWPGTVRVPAPCQYAHKLASLVGQHLHKLPNDQLCDRLFFL